MVIDSTRSKPSSVRSEPVGGLSSRQRRLSPPKRERLSRNHFALLSLLLLVAVFACGGDSQSPPSSSPSAVQTPLDPNALRVAVFVNAANHIADLVVKLAATPEER